MSNKLPDRVRMSVTGTPGTGDVSLNLATSGYQTLTNAGVSTGDTFPYVIEDGANWEIGLGTYNSSGPSFARTTVRASSGGGTSKITATSNAIVYSSIMGEDIPAPGAAPAISNLADTTITSPANNDVLTYNSTDVKWENKPASGGGGGITFTQPSIVQQAVANGSVTSVTLGSTPTPGNLLVALATHYSNGTTLVAGWTTISQADSGNDGINIGYRVVSSSDTTTISVLSSGTGSNISVFEIENFNGLSVLNTSTYYTNASGATNSLTVGATEGNNLILGIFATSGSLSLPTVAGTGVTTGTTDTTSSGSGSPRGITTFSANGAVGAEVISATWSGTVNNYGAVVALNPKIS